MSVAGVGRPQVKAATGWLVSGRPSEVEFVAAAGGAGTTAAYACVTRPRLRLKWFGSRLLGSIRARNDELATNAGIRA